MDSEYKYEIQARAMDKGSRGCRECAANSLPDRILRAARVQRRRREMDAGTFPRVCRDQDRYLARKALKKAEQSCLVARALNFAITMEASIGVAAQALIP
jgi:hypothetical protein